MKPKSYNPMPSKSPCDAVHNIEALDEFTNSQDPTYEDRFDQERQTLSAMKAGMEDRFQETLSKIGYEQLGDYAAGIEITEYNQIFRHEGEWWRASASLELPYTTTGDWDTEGGLFVGVGEAALRQELASEGGAGYVGYDAETTYPDSTVGSYLSRLAVNAGSFGETLNEAVAAISNAYAGQRVRVFVPSGMPITDTVSFGTDMDIDWSYVEVTEDVDVIFDPAEGWSGTTSPVVIEVNNKSCRVGWNLRKPLVEVDIGRCVFQNIGNESENTSADLWQAFHMRHYDTGRIILREPTVINSYVVPNGITGDNIGPNRNIVIEGSAPAGSTPSDITIYNHTSINLIPEEDADAIAINCGADTELGYEFNIDIHGGTAINVQRRMYKIMGRGRETKGIRIHGHSYAKAGGVYPWTGVDVSDKVTVDWNGALEQEGYIIGMYLWAGAVVQGNLDLKYKQVLAPAVLYGNFTRAVLLNSLDLDNNFVGESKLDCDSVECIGGGELIQVSTGSHFVANNAKHIGANRSLTISGKARIGTLEFEIVPASGADRSAAPLRVINEPSARVNIGWLDARLSPGVSGPTAVAFTGGNLSTIMGGIIDGFTDNNILLNGCTRTKLFGLNSTSGTRLVFTSNGRYAIISGCTSPNEVHFNSPSAPMQDVEVFASSSW